MPARGQVAITTVLKHNNRMAFIKAGHWPAAALLLAFAVLPACSKEEKKAPEPVSRDWAVTLQRDGTGYKLPVKLMNVFLVEDESYPEKFRIEGEGLQLVGEIPVEVHIGYGVNWSVLIDRPVEIRGSYNFWGAEEPSYIQLPDLPRYEVIGGTLNVEKTSGTSAGVDGDLAIHGTITLKVKTALGEETLQGTFFIHGVTWG